MGCWWMLGASVTQEERSGSVLCAQIQVVLRDIVLRLLEKKYWEQWEETT
jgi:hypothetical protein